MPAGVMFTKKSEADAYATTEAGKVISVTDQDGTVIGYNVVDNEMPVGEAISSAKNRNMGGTMDDEMGYMHGGMHGKPKKMFKGGAAIKGRGFKGIH
tara:strand:+ start:587 stop:877 length:291 start_codon:yes stop_codon:yes gene_type:complete